LAFLGFLDATFLTASHYLRFPLPCSVLNGCEVVTTSVYSTLFGVPIALIGALYYLAMFVLSVAALERKRPRLLQPVFALSALGLAVSLVLVFIQLVVIGSICPYCMVSAITTTAVFGTAFWAARGYLGPSSAHVEDGPDGDADADGDAA
ncbi:vitamin K epoxide reductase family protein, partial [Patescibacteria group bacterium]|nr:vitamin K epoxide reductase family protein [Patescibacteria group bacterium]